MCKEDLLGTWPVSSCGGGLGARALRVCMFWHLGWRETNSGSRGGEGGAGGAVPFHACPRGPRVVAVCECHAEGGGSTPSRRGGYRIRGARHMVTGARPQTRVPTWRGGVPIGGGRELHPLGRNPSHPSVAPQRFQCGTEPAPPAPWTLHAQRMQNSERAHPPQLYIPVEWHAR